MWTCTVDLHTRLRALQPEDAAALEALRVDYTAFRNEWLYPGTAADFIAASLATLTRGEGFWAGVWVGEALAGAIGLHLGPGGEMQSDGLAGRIDYMLGTAYRGRGVMTRCVRVLAREAFCGFGAPRLEIRSDAANAASCAVAERAGFARAALFPNAIDYGPDRGDLVVYAALRTDWLANEAPA